MLYHEESLKVVNNSLRNNLPPGHFKAFNKLLDLPDFDITVGGRLLVRHFCVLEVAWFLFNNFVPSFWMGFPGI